MPATPSPPAQDGGQPHLPVDGEGKNEYRRPHALHDINTTRKRFFLQTF